ncbi:putative periplasmic iron-binding protein precursor [Variibacter gotjawalensis]|uniref:Putative periplasmic iron-binding protein n=1 Tax=Variibacter gotjawalensis TaxID=1333996 RepID=A0A0S3PTJ3_9BRAD|nr:zinc ABC transporter substrate-binding protein [Variibacter gotjawalensis]NIK49518.1 zinc/manganese transport system substrate-binding protein [Variibacter gotjawalensis]RZS51370.1 zinc/manganese transport system substrate-binding protein [Variibacter gotjawalensis]BAT59203.1 putative periplasmic iron-binding protein precursor [Variibacter gotjawalensis]
MLRILTIAFLSLLALPAYAQEKLKVVASFSILADITRQVGGDRIDVTSFVGPNTDMHVFQPTPADAKRMQGAKVIIVNGLGFEGWAERLAKASGFKGKLTVASEGVKAREEAHDHDHKHDHGHADHDHTDPHAWQSVANVKLYVANIAKALIAADAAGREGYEERARAYTQKLEALEKDIVAAFADVPADKRRVITSHHAFGYFGDAYKVTFLAPQGVTGDSEPTAKAVAALIRQIKKENIRAVFVENISSPRVIERIAKETGAQLGGTLFSDALSDAKGPAADYIAMMQHNTKLLASALK